MRVAIVRACVHVLRFCQLLSLPLSKVEAWSAGRDRPANGAMLELITDNGATRVEVVE